MPSIGYLGPRGTFTQEALEANLKSQFDPEVPFATIPEVLNAVQSGDVDSGIVPIENSIEGSVNVTLDTLAFETDLVIEREVVQPVKHCLIARPGVSRDQIEGIVSHPQATAQCRGFLARWFGDVPITAANSTADAAMEVSRSDRPLAAIGTELAARIYGLEVLDRDMEDYPGNVTRFVVVGRQKAARTGKDKTSIACFIQANRPGSLLEILQEFASRGVDLTKIESRPTKKVLGEYYFFIDIEGHVGDTEVAAAIGSLVGKLRELKLLGSYPAA
ncbi:MAG: prephenate dehydratase [Candidatus Geothermincolia bacterium]